MQKCTLGLGCFWNPEENFRNKPGIIETEVGYAGGLNSNVSYEEVCTGNSGHAEVVRLTFNESKTSFKKILDEFNKKLDGKIKTNISKIKNYCKAEKYHQKYIEKKR